MDRATVIFTALALMLTVHEFLAEAQKPKSTVGVSYGMMVSNLPTGTNVVRLLTKNNIGRVRIYNANEEVLTALKNTGIETIIGVRNEELQQISQSPSAAMQWVKQYVTPVYPAAKITHISVGNEVFINREFLPFLLPAMRNVQNAINAAGLKGKIMVSTAHPDSVITDFTPPSKAQFDVDIKAQMKNVVQFLKENRSPFLVHIHPYFAHTRSRGFVTLDYATFMLKKPFVTDPKTGKAYLNVFDAIHDSILAAMSDVGFSGIPIVVTETGWPSTGGRNATVQNAMLYNNNLIKHATANNIQTYIFSLYDEDKTLSRFDSTEPHFGLFSPDGTPKYSLNFAASASSSSSAPTASEETASHGKIDF